VITDESARPAPRPQTATELALQASELRYRRLFETAQDGILILDYAAGRITDANPFLVTLLGFSHAEMVGHTVGELSPFKDIVSNQAMLERLQAVGYVRYEDLPLKTRDGRQIAVEFVSNVYKAGGEKVIQCNIRDITARKRAEQQLTLLNTCVAHLNEMVVITEAGPADGSVPVIVFVNAAFERITGYTSAEALGRNPSFLQGEKTDPRIVGELHHALEQQQPIRRQMLNYRKNGAEYWVDVDIMPVFGPAGRCTHFVAVERDITEEKQNDELLRYKTMLLEAQLESSIDGILVVDNQQNMVLQNRRLGELWNIPAPISTGKYDAAQLRFAATQTKNPEQFVEKVNYLYAHPEETSQDEIELINGTVLDRYSAPVRDRSGQHHGRIWSFRDLTERRRMEGQLQQMQKMECIGQLAGGIAHDFNNILTALVGNIFLVKTDASITPDILEYLENMTTATQRATDLVNQILAFSRQNRPERTAIQLNHVVLEALKLLRASLPANIRIQTELTETPLVLANATAIHQVIMNLGTNAWHAMRPNPGVLKVDMKTMEADADFVKLHPGLLPGSYVMLSVSDSGCGMDRATLARAFDPFFTTKEVGEGTGLGLAVVHGIIRSHEGAITAYSQPGAGTVFHLYFPALAAESVVLESASAPIPRGQGQHILLVDDEEVLAQLGRRILERLGYTVTVTTSPLEALAAARENPGGFALLITDLTMPVMDGISLGRQMRLLQPDLRMILTTGYSGVLTTAKVREMGFQELLDKPVNARALGETVDRVLRQTAVRTADATPRDAA